jgi:hypothetical protein
VYLKAILICDDVRFELGGAITLVGVRPERLVGVRQGAAIVFPRLTFVTTIGGLRGATQVRFRHLPFAGAAPPPMRDEPHDAASDEHTFVLGDAPFGFPAPGRYELATEIEAGGEAATYRYAFHVDAP